MNDICMSSIHTLSEHLSSLLFLLSCARVEKRRFKFTKPNRDERKRKSFVVKSKLQKSKSKKYEVSH